jgi:hypothetical protein
MEVLQESLRKFVAYLLLHNIRKKSAMKTLTLVTFLAFFKYSAAQVSQTADSVRIKQTTYTYCKLRTSEGSGKFEMDFGKNSRTYTREIGLDTLVKPGNIITILNRMGEYGWELTTVFTETDYFFSTPQTYQNWVLRKTGD